MVPILLYHGIEKPMIGIGVRLAGHMSGTQTVSAFLARPNLETGSHKFDLQEEVAS